MQLDDKPDATGEPKYRELAGGGGLLLEPHDRNDETSQQRVRFRELCTERYRRLSDGADAAPSTQH